MSHSGNDAAYFYILHQVEIDLEIDHQELIDASRGLLDFWLDEWFNRRSNVTGIRRKPTEDLKQGVFDWKEEERELEEE
ncbi:MAG: hypothetical protein E6L04_07420 [Thaumarchaeota archaeon]|nr:MAG: hypothetical protein E6L04_07420 [Nitrososphaerota archaeon]